MKCVVMISGKDVFHEEKNPTSERIMYEQHYNIRRIKAMLMTRQKWKLGARLYQPTARIERKDVCERKH